MPRGAGNRHSKNAGTMGSENMTYAERKHLGHGTIKERLGKETVKDFDSCALGLQHAKVRDHKNSRDGARACLWLCEDLTGSRTFS